MKVNETFRFAHPVLTESSEDYPQGVIALNLKVSERPATGQLELDYELDLRPASLLELVQTGRARSCLSVVCRESFFNEMFPMDGIAGHLRLGAGLLSGRVQIRSILASTDSGVFELDGTNDEYPSTKFTLDAGSILAWSEAQFITVGMEKLAPMESIFRLSRDDGLPEGKFGVALDQEFISIRAPVKLLSTIDAMRGSALAKPVVLNSVYFPAVVAVLDAVKADAGSYAEKRWFRVIMAKAEFTQMDLETGDSLDQAQDLLKLPAGRLTQFMEKIP